MSLLPSAFLVLVSYCLAQVDAGEKNENVRLDKRYANVQTLKEYRDPQRYQRKKHQRDHFAGEHVGKETNGQRQHASQVAEDFDRET